jgi:hypothetical protein
MSSAVGSHASNVLGVKEKRNDPTFAKDHDDCHPLLLRSRIVDGRSQIDDNNGRHYLVPDPGGRTGTA